MKTSLESGVWSPDSTAQQRRDTYLSQILASLLCEATAQLTAHAVPDAQLDAEVLLAYVLGTNRAGLYARLHDPYSSQHAQAFQHLVQRRARREPLQYITGVQEFWSLPFRVDQRVLIPRPETEVVVETALRLLSQSAIGNRQSTIEQPPHPGPLPQGERRISILDLGTGSGCIAIALATELPRAEIWATDISQDALAVTQENARRHGVAGRITFLHGDLFIPTVRAEDRFDLIVANPPYIAHDDLATLQPEVRDWEPHSALDGGVEGLDFYYRLLSEGPDYLRPGSWLVMEIGRGQSAQVLRFAQDQQSLGNCFCIPDYTGKARVIVACKRQT